MNTLPKICGCNMNLNSGSEKTAVWEGAVVRLDSLKTHCSAIPYLIHAFTFTHFMSSQPFVENLH